MATATLIVIATSTRPWRRLRRDYDTDAGLNAAVAELDRDHTILHDVGAVVVVEMPSGVTYILGRFDYTARFPYAQG